MPNTPFPSKRAPVFQDVPDEQWNDWHWQLSHRLNTVADFEQLAAVSIHFKDQYFESRGYVEKNNRLIHYNNFFRFSNCLFS